MEGRVPCGSKALKCKHLSPASFCEVAARAFCHTFSKRYIGLCAAGIDSLGFKIYEFGGFPGLGVMEP